jgi:hypothetical protein
MSHDHFSPAFLSSSLNPVQVITIELYLLESYLSASDKVRRNGRLPRAIRSYLGSDHEFLIFLFGDSGFDSRMKL